MDSLADSLDPNPQRNIATSSENENGEIPEPPVEDGIEPPAGKGAPIARARKDSARPRGDSFVSTTSPR